MKDNLFREYLIRLIILSSVFFALATIGIFWGGKMLVSTTIYYLLTMCLSAFFAGIFTISDAEKMQDKHLNPWAFSYRLIRKLTMVAGIIVLSATLWFVIKILIKQISQLI